MRKIINSAIAIILCICMVVPVMGTASAVSVGKVSGLTVSSSTATTVTLKWKKASKAKNYRVYVYDTKDKEWDQVAKTSSTSVKVTGLSSAKSYKFRVRAYNGSSKGKYSSSVTALTSPKKVSSLSVSSVTTTSAKLSWSKVTRATGYKVYRYDNSAKAWKLIKTTSSRSLTVKGLESGTISKYKVRAYYKSGDKTKNGAYSSVVAVMTKPGKVTGLKVSNVTENGYKLSWGKVKNADQYQVYRYGSDGWERLTTVTATSCNVRDSSGIEASYKVRAVVKNGSVSANGSFSSTVKASSEVASTEGTVSTSVPVPQNLNLVAVPEDENIIISWDEVEGVKGYQVYRYDARNEEWVRIRSTSDTMIKYNVSSSGYHYFKVRSYKTLNGDNVYSDFTPQASVYYMSNEAEDSDDVISDLERSGILGYLYDSEYNCFYTAEDPWQRAFGFTPVYDFCAPFTIMFYSTERIKFKYDGLEWMIQIWKGQYGWVFIGSEIGVYTRKGSLPLDFYSCAEDENMLKMRMILYYNGQQIIERPYEKYWWCTGFVPGTLVSTIVSVPSGNINTDKLTMYAGITMKDEEMLEAFCGALEANGFIKNGYGVRKAYVCDGLDVIFTWT